MKAGDGIFSCKRFRLSDHLLMEFSFPRLMIPKLMADPDKFLSFGQIMSGSAGHLLPYLDR